MDHLHVLHSRWSLWSNWWYSSHLSKLLLQRGHILLGKEYFLLLFRLDFKPSLLLILSYIFGRIFVNADSDKLHPIDRVLGFSILRLFSFRYLLNLVESTRFELVTFCASICHSTNWVTIPIMVYEVGFEPTIACGDGFTGRSLTIRVTHTLMLSARFELMDYSLLANVFHYIHIYIKVNIFYIIFVYFSIKQI